MIDLPDDAFSKDDLAWRSTTSGERRGSVCFDHLDTLLLVRMYIFTYSILLVHRYDLLLFDYFDSACNTVNAAMSRVLYILA